MSVLNVVLLVLFIIVAFLLVLLVLVQTEEGDSLGGVFAGGSSSAFGSRSGNILTKATSVLGAVFLVISFSLALLNRSPSPSGVELEGRKNSADRTNQWYLEDNAEDGAETGADTSIEAPLDGNTEPANEENTDN